MEAIVIYQYESALAIEYCDIMGKELANCLGVYFDEDRYWKSVYEMDSRSLNNLFLLSNQNTIVIFDCNNKDIMYDIVVLGLDEKNEVIQDILLKWHKVCEDEYHMIKIDKIKNVYGEQDTSLKYIRNYYKHDILSLCEEGRQFKVFTAKYIENYERFFSQAKISIELAISHLFHESRDENIYIFSFMFCPRINGTYRCSICANTEEHFSKCMVSEQVDRFSGVIFRYHESKWKYKDVTYGVDYISQFLDYNFGDSALEDEVEYQVMTVIKDVFVTLRKDAFFKEYTDRDILLSFYGNDGVLTREQMIELVVAANQNIKETSTYIENLDIFM